MNFCHIYTHVNLPVWHFQPRKSGGQNKETFQTLAEKEKNCNIVKIILCMQLLLLMLTLPGYTLKPT
jgi:hypothetical protein